MLFFWRTKYGLCTPILWFHLVLWVIHDHILLISWKIILIETMDSLSPILEHTILNFYSILKTKISGIRTINTSLPQETWRLRCLVCNKHTKEWSMCLSWHTCTTGTQARTCTAIDWTCSVEIIWRSVLSQDTKPFQLCFDYYLINKIALS